MPQSEIRCLALFTKSLLTIWMTSDGEQRKAQRWHGCNGNNQYHVTLRNEGGHERRCTI